MNFLDRFSSPQLQKLHSGKVRDSFRIDDRTRMIVVSDRLSAFDKVLETPIPTKGAILNGIANFWFEKSQDICENHFIEVIDPNISLVKEAEPIKVEMIVRGFLTGSIWREYERGKRIFSGVKLPDGLKRNQKLQTPILTPTTKEKNDREISPEEILQTGLADPGTWSKMAEISLKLFERGRELLEPKGFLLADTKYEFGKVGGKVILIDEIHTPDSSRFWSIAKYTKDPMSVDSLDKEYVREWLRKNIVDSAYPSVLPPEVVIETTKRYREIYSIITGQEFRISNTEVKTRIASNLIAKGLIKPGYVVIFMGSPSDIVHAKKIADVVESYGIKTDLRVVSAHKNGERIAEMVAEYNDSIEPGAAIAVAGRSNGLGGALGANLNIPVISCPPFTGKDDLMLNINSSLFMPSKIPASIILDPESAALGALRSLNIPSLRDKFSQEITRMKKSLMVEDERIRRG
ncbi:MAG: phosphoribosylaminoimidazolesuccinocarboxamide synthase [Candidatus Riflebacteria bacterium]|nr:phosphoribosylaminoimidazolesuccinocarboxamide synthase [Candidatus Riflebacteria bacterium]